MFICLLKLRYKVLKQKNENIQEKVFWETLHTLSKVIEISSTQHLYIVYQHVIAKYHAVIIINYKK